MFTQIISSFQPHIKSFRYTLITLLHCNYNKYCNILSLFPYQSVLRFNSNFFRKDKKRILAYKLGSAKKVQQNWVPVKLP